LLDGKTYVGQSTKSGQALTKYLGSGIHLKRAVEKYGASNFKKEVIGTAETKQELDYLEIEMISLLKPEYNIASGGQGGNLGPEVNRLKAGNLNGMYGRGHTEESVAKIREATRLQFAALGHPRATRIVCVELRRLFGTIKEAASDLGVSFSHIGAVCRGERRMAGGFHFLYEKDFLNLPQNDVDVLIEDIGAESVKWARKGYHGANSREVVCLESRQRYISIIEASTQTGADTQGIYQCCVGERLTSNGLHWMYATDFDSSPEAKVVEVMNRKDPRFVFSGTNPYASKAVVCLETGVKYASATEAMKATGANNSLIGKCASGEARSAGGFTWKWASS